MLDAERQFCRVMIGYQQLATLAVAIERDILDADGTVWCEITDTVSVQKSDLQPRFEAYVAPMRTSCLALMGDSPIGVRGAGAERLQRRGG